MEKVRRVLVYRLGSLGDTVVALPLLHLVEQAYPDAEKRLLTNVPVHAKAPAAQAVLEGSGLVDGYFHYPVGTRNPFRLLNLWWQIRQWRPEVLVYAAAARGVEVARRDQRFLALCGVRQMVGVPLTDAMQRNFYGKESGSEDQEPEAERLVRNVAALGGVSLAEPGAWDLRLTAAERGLASQAVGPAIAVSIGTKVQAKDWGVENWRELLAVLSRRYPGHALWMVGAAEERAASELAASNWAGTVVNLCGELTPRETAAVLARAKVFLGHDSGPMHLAAAVQTTCVAVFAARNIPRVWFPYGPRHRVIYHAVECMGCGLETCILERKRCLLSITPEEVLAAVVEVLG